MAAVAERVTYDRSLLLLGCSILLYGSLTSANLYSILYLWSLAVAFMIGYLTKDLEGPLMAMVIFLALWLLMSWAFPITTNPNVLGCMLALALAAAMMYNWIIPATVIFVGVLWTQSRGAILAACAVLIVWLWQHNKTIMLCVVATTILLLSSLSLERFDSVGHRLGIWQDTFNHMTPVGEGWGGFAKAYQLFPVKTNVTLFQPKHAYNDFIEILFEFGLFALVIWVFIFMCLNSPRPKLMLLAYGILALTYFPLHIPVVGHLSILALGHVAAGRNYGG